ncbi:putative reverse transcriptase domain-containing protein [Tanacetum coccineum]
MVPKKRTTRSSPATTTTTTTPITEDQLKALIAQGVADVLAERDATRSRNGEDSHDLGTGVKRTERAASTYNDFLKCQPLNFKGTEGVGIALTWWNSHVKTVTHDVAYAMTWKTLKKMMTDKYCPRGEIKKLEIEMWNLKVKESDEIEKYVGGLPDMIHGSVMASKPKTMQDAIEFATELMDKKISTLDEGQVENKRKLDYNNQAQQQPPKKQGVAIAYTARPGERKEHAGTLPLCNKCNFHHNGQCTVKCANCKRVGHLARDCRSPAATNNQRNLTCYEYGNQGHYRRLCHAESSHHVTFVNKSIFTYSLKEQSSVRRHLIPNPKPRSRDTSLVTLGQFAIKLARQKSYADLRHKPLEFQVGDRAMLKVSPWKGVVRFGKQGKLNPIYVGPFKALAKVGAIAYKLELPQELIRVHHTFHVSNLKKCYADEPLAVSLKGLHIDDKLYFIEEPIEIMDREVKRLKQSRIPIFKKICNNDKNLSEIQLEHEKEDELVVVVVKVVHELDCMMVVKEIENGFLEKVEKLEWWLEQDIDDEGEEDEED